MNLHELIEARRRGRSWRSLGAAVDSSDNTVRGWARGKHPMPEYKAEPIAAWLGGGTTETEILSAANESRRAYLAGEAVGAPGDAVFVTKAGGRGKGLMQDERDEIGAVAKLLAEAAERLARIAAQRSED